LAVKSSESPSLLMLFCRRCPFVASGAAETIPVSLRGRFIRVFGIATQFAPAHTHTSHAWTACIHQTNHTPEPLDNIQDCQLELLLCTAVQEWWLHRARGPFLPGRALLPPVAVPAAPSHTISCLLHVTTKILSASETRTTIACGPCTLRPSPCAHQIT
jgi:hypothetical protein